MFDPRKLEKIDGYWNIKACTGNKFIEEINPMFTKNIPREKVIKQINKLKDEHGVIPGKPIPEIPAEQSTISNVEDPEKEPEQLN